MYRSGRRNTNLKYLNGFNEILGTVVEKYAEGLKSSQCGLHKNIPDLCMEKLKDNMCSSEEKQRNETRMYRLFISEQISKLSWVPSHFINEWSNLQHSNEISLPSFDINSNAIVDFIQGIHTVCGTEAVKNQNGLAIHIYLFNTNMENKCLCNNDGDFLIVPQIGVLFVTTEFGKMTIYPGEIGVIQSGMHFKVDIVRDDNIITHRGYILEVFNSHFKLPTNYGINNDNLVKPEHFQVPVAALDDEKSLNRDYEVYVKINHGLYKKTHDKSPFNVVAWKGNYFPYKYNLSNLGELNFSSSNSDNNNNKDFAMCTVLTCQSIANFVIFSPQENTLEQSEIYRHLSEFMSVFNGDKNLKLQSYFRNIPQPYKSNYNDFVNSSIIHTSQLAFMFGCSFNLSVAKWAVDISEKSAHREYTA